MGDKPETASTTPDGEGFISLFNGKDLTGWWENCQTHTTDNNLGGVWIADSNQGLLYSREEGQNGDILVTNQSFDNYELIFDVWPIFGNDGGIFNRVTASGSCWQSTLDYISGSSVGGSYNEKNWFGSNLNDDPYLFGGSPSNPEIKDWTSFTKNLDPTSFECNASGCNSSDFIKVWDTDGWNQFRVKFYDGLTPGRSVHMQNYFRKLGAANWVPAYDKIIARVTPAGPIAIQIHGAGRWKSGAYNIYRNIKIRPLDISGNPLTTSNFKTSAPEKVSLQLKLEGETITGTLTESSTITLTDLQGQLLERFNSTSGTVSHKISSEFHGIFFLELKTSHKKYHIRMNRI